MLYLVSTLSNNNAQLKGNGHLHKAKVPSLQIRRIRTMALETFKIVNKIAPVYIQNLVGVKNSKYSNSF